MTGRNYIHIDNYIVTLLRERSLSWNNIASRPQVNVHRDTLRLWRFRTNFVEPRISLSDENLDALIINHIGGELQRGMVNIEAFLSINGYTVPRAQLCASMHRVDAEGVAARARRTIQRRVYSVIGPHHLWHHDDGNHKLIRYEIVIHGCIDGRTRTVIYLSARDSNTAITVLRLFEDGVRRFRLPSRARGDRGGENRRVCDFMIEHRGTGRHSYIAGTH